MPARRYREKGNTVQHLTLQEAVEKLHMKTSVKKLNVKNEKELTQPPQKHAKHSDMTVKNVQKETPAKLLRQYAENRKPIKIRRLTMQNRQITQTTAAEKTPSSVSAYEKKVVELTNAERQKQGLKPLQIDDKLSKSAHAKSQDMKDKNYFDHQSPTYGSPFDMMKSFGITYKTAGENIAKGQPTPEAVVKAWMNSEGHRKNIMNPEFTQIGVGYVESGNIWTQQFIGK